MRSTALIAFALTLATPKVEGFLAPASNSPSMRVSGLHAIVEPPVPAPAEHQDQEGNQEVEKSEWTKTKGGFIPNLIRRKIKKSAGPKPHVEHVETIHEYKTAVADEEERIVVVRFFAPWCRSCRAAAPPFLKMVSNYSPGVKFVEVPLTKSNAYLHQGLGVPSVPFAHIYHPDAGLVEEMKMNKRDFPQVEKVLEEYVAGSCSLPLVEEYTDEEGLNEFQ